jgi:putative transposase
MRKSRYTEEQIVGILKESEAGMATAELCRKHGISEQTFYRWKAKYGDLEVGDAQRLRQLEENRKLKQLGIGFWSQGIPEKTHRPGLVLPRRRCQQSRARAQIRLLRLRLRTISENNVTLHFITPRRPMENGYIENFHDKSARSA